MRLNNLPKITQLLMGVVVLVVVTFEFRQFGFLFLSKKPHPVSESHTFVTQYFYVDGYT